MTTTTLTETSRQRLMNVLTEALDTYLGCNCSYNSGDEPSCDGTCTHSRAKAALAELEAGAVTFPTTALEEEHPWCKWTTAFSHGSDWDTCCFGLERMVGINVLLTTADGRSRPVSITEWQHIRKEYAERADPNVDNPERQAGILFRELDTEDYEPIVDDAPGFAAYEDIREICVF